MRNLVARRSLSLRAFPGGRFVRDVLTSVVATGIATVAFSSLRTAPPRETVMAPPTLSASGKIVERLDGTITEEVSGNHSQTLPAMAKIDLAAWHPQNAGWAPDRSLERVVIVAAAKPAVPSSERVRTAASKTLPTPLPPTRPAAAEVAVASHEEPAPRVFGIIPRRFLPPVPGRETWTKIAELSGTLIDRVTPDVPWR